MLKLFFNRSSFMVAFMNGVAAFEMGWLIWRAWTGKSSLGAATLFLMVSWWGINLLNWIPWYPENKDSDGKPAKLGIRLHFHKCVVPIGYILTLAFTLKLLGASELAMLPFGLLFLPIFYVAGILLYFHFRDRSSLTPGYFSHNFYLKDKDPTCTP
ncbi:MAG: hypothetical protein K8R69_01785 [Deltaproteobacteria bacterium]|nr:hypothetical protein [Deltaproteobacteria bacterium]